MIDSKNEELSKKTEELKEVREERNDLMKRLQYLEDERETYQRIEIEINHKVHIILH